MTNQPVAPSASTPIQAATPSPPPSVSVAPPSSATPSHLHSVDSPHDTQPGAPGAAPYFTAGPPQASMAMYAPPYQYSAAPPYAFTPGFYAPQPPPMYLPWQQQPFQYYAHPHHHPPPHQPPIWPPDTEAKRSSAASSQQHIHMQQHHQTQPLQHQPFSYSRAAPAPTPVHHSTQHSYAFAVSGHDHKAAHDSTNAVPRTQSSPHSKRGGRRRSGGSTQFGSIPNASASNSASSTPSKARPPSRAPAVKSELEEIEENALVLAVSAKEAVASNDEVTIALLLTSWASQLEVAQNHSEHSVTPKFDAVFRASHALEIVSERILFMHINADSAVHKALVSLYGFVLYGDEVMHRRLADETRILRDSLGSHSSDESAIDHLVSTLEKNLYLDDSIGLHTLTYKQAAVYKVLRVLRNVSEDVAAYNGILPTAASGSSQGNIGSGSLSPAGPDPTKVVERSMDSWRRACARLQGEMAIIVVLESALTTMDDQLAPPTGSSSQLAEFFASVSKIVKARLQSDIEHRNKVLRETWWTHVATADANSIFDAVDARSLEWLGMFQSGLSEVEAQLNNIGLGFGPAARVSTPKVPALVNCSARVAALVSTHTHALDWCNQTTKLLSGMSVAFRALSETHGGLYGPPKHLVESFHNGVDRASVAIVSVQEWSFETVYEKILGSLQKSASTSSQKIKGIRFEEPERTEIVRNLSMDSQDEGKTGDGGSQKRRKPRHARMKSSPDELLHLNAHLEVANGNRHNLEEIESCGESSDASPQKLKTTIERNSPVSLVTVASDESSKSVDEVVVAQSCTESKLGEGEHKEELAVVYEEKLLEYEDEEDRHIVVREDVVEMVPDEDVNGRKKVHHARSMSVDGIVQSFTGYQ